MDKTEVKLNFFKYLNKMRICDHALASAYELIDPKLKSCLKKCLASLHTLYEHKAVEQYSLVRKKYNSVSVQIEQEAKDLALFIYEYDYAAPSRALAALIQAYLAGINDLWVICIVPDNLFILYQNNFILEKNNLDSKIINKNINMLTAWELAGVENIAIVAESDFLKYFLNFLNNNCTYKLTEETTQAGCDWISVDQISDTQLSTVVALQQNAIICLGYPELIINSINLNWLLGKQKNTFWIEGAEPLILLDRQQEHCFLILQQLYPDAVLKIFDIPDMPDISDILVFSDLADFNKILLAESSDKMLGNKVLISNRLTFEQSVQDSSASKNLFSEFLFEKIQNDFYLSLTESTFPCWFWSDLDLKFFKKNRIKII